MLRTLLSALLLAALCTDAAADAMPKIAGGSFESVLPPAAGVKNATVESYRLDRKPVTNAEFAEFVRKHPQWRRDRVTPLFAEEQYLAQWTSAIEPGAAIAGQPVVHVSWFAASAYCEARGARLPTWYEWEYAETIKTAAHDLHAVAWEWVYDLSSLLVSADNREQSEPDSLRFCGPGALTMEQKENYATIMRIAMLSSVQARYAGAQMGFRCAVETAP
jgi:formylglycine-generating enzyme required for sulfatase activity